METKWRLLRGLERKMENNRRLKGLTGKEFLRLETRKPSVLRASGKCKRKLIEMISFYW
jgi:hypothetical protein